MSKRDICPAIEMKRFEAEWQYIMVQPFEIDGSNINRHSDRFQVHVAENIHKLSDTFIEHLFEYQEDVIPWIIDIAKSYMVERALSSQVV